jgi:SAM-dependent methyltransferase
MNADSIAGVYRMLEYLAFGRALERCRFSSLDALRDARHVLIAGEGDGRFLARLLALNPRARVDVVDSSTRMMALARKRVGDAERVRFLHQDAFDPLPPGPYDAVVTNFFLDCLTEEECAGFVAVAAGRLKAGGLWVVGDFHLPARGWGRWHACVWLTVMYRFFALATGLRARRIPDFRGSLGRAGLARLSQRYWRWGLLTAEVWKFP